VARVARVTIGRHERVDGQRLSGHLGLGLVLEAELRAQSIVHHRLYRVVASRLDRKGAGGKDILGRGRSRRRSDLSELAVLLLLLLLLLLREPLSGKLDVVWVLAAWFDIVWLCGGAAGRCC
jgi:hypothetical protein